MLQQYNYLPSTPTVSPQSVTAKNLKFKRLEQPWSASCTAIPDEAVQSAFSTTAAHLLVVAEMSAVFLRAGDESEVRHRNNAGDSVEHGDDVDRALRRASAADRRVTLHQHGLYRCFHARVHHQAGRSALVLLQATVERVRFHRRHYLHPR